jgi:NAD-dependent dihydropyrimidine dehydrogenase PreA subunit
MAKRKIISIDEDRCNGCGKCVPDCPEGALQIIDGKARLISDIFCDGLGACIGTCPEGAISTIEREAQEYSEARTMENIVRAGPNTIRAHLKHLKDHGQERYHAEALRFLEERGIPTPQPEPERLACGCPGEMQRTLEPQDACDEMGCRQSSELRQWPVQIHLLNPNAPFFDNSHLLILADCVAAANPNLHSELIRGKTVAMGCPKLDDADAYVEKLAAIIKANRIRSVTVAVMQVPCCGGMVRIAQEAVRLSGKDLKVEKVTLSLEGEVM